ncbi:F-box only protein 4 [Gouania willdenowi]|uniref:F-box domain-containing protein n=1 Tax=Gouania willdenowi TaxID=441366 RepID=A0A8C5EFA7_GOUWI|nr:F-box only protein 4 [Gouania willdenowi]
MAERIRELEAVVVRNLRRFKDAYFTNTVTRDETLPVKEQQIMGLLDNLPVNLQFFIMTFLSPADLCRLGSTSRYWRAMVRDPLLWKYFLLRDVPSWPSIDHLSMPNLELLESPLLSEDEPLHDEDEEEEEEEEERKIDFMSEYLRGCPSCRNHVIPSRPVYQVMTSFLHSLVPSSEPRYAMFGPGMEQLEVSLVKRMMFAPDVLPVSGTPHRQINGIGSGISYMFNNQHRFNILTLYTTNRAERERAREQQQQEGINNKLFNCVGNDASGFPVFTPAPQVQEVCEVVDGFIYVANAEPGKGEEKTEVAQIRAMLNCRRGSSSKPLLVLACVSREEPVMDQRDGSDRARARTPCVYVAKRLNLPQISHCWMVQDTVAESLSGLLDGISWLLKCSGVKLHGS